MIAMEGMASLNLVKQEVDATLKQAEASLRVFMEERDDVQPLQTALELFQQLQGIFTLIHLDGAVTLTHDVVSLGEHIIEEFQCREEITSYLMAMGRALLVLSHYIDFVHIKQSSLPVLLVPTINELRKHLVSPLVSEYDFSNIDLNPTQFEDTPLVDSAETVPFSEVPMRCRRLRHMYQVGFLGVMRKESPTANLKIMTRALERIARLTGDVPIAQLWWIGLGILEALLDGDVELCVSRKLLLGKIDRQMKRLIYEGVTVLNDTMPQSLLRECLYVISLAACDGNYVSSIKDAFGLRKIVGITDKQLREDRDIMNGPYGSVIATVAANIQEELTQMKDNIDTSVRSVVMDQSYLQSLAESLTKISSTLVMLGLNEASDVLKEQVQCIRIWLSQTEVLGPDDFLKLADALLYAEHMVEVLRSNFSHNSVPDEQEQVQQENLENPDSIEKVAINRLEEARLLVVSESRVGLSMTKKAIVSFIESHWDAVHLQNVPSTLHTVWGGLVFLHLKRAAEVIGACEAYIQRNIIHNCSYQPKQLDLETLADAISSIDYYLESMEESRPIGLGVIEVAEESINELNAMAR